MTISDQNKTSLELKIDELELQEYRDYVFAREKSKTNDEAHNVAGISHAKFYGWDKELRDYLNQLAFELRTDTALKARMILSEATDRAATIKVEGLDSRDMRVKQAASTEILDRMLGKPTQRQEDKQSGEITIKIVREDGQI